MGTGTVLPWGARCFSAIQLYQCRKVHSCTTLRAQEYGHLHRWMVYIDADEFLVIKDGTPNLPTLLQDYIKYGGLGVFWVVFGSSGHVKRPENGALGSYYRSGPCRHEPQEMLPSNVRRKML